MDSKEVTQTIGQALIWSFDKLSFNPDTSFKNAQDYTISEWKHHQGLLAGGGLEVVQLSYRASISNTRAFVELELVPGPLARCDYGGIMAPLSGSTCT